MELQTAVRTPGHRQVSAAGQGEDLVRVLVFAFQGTGSPQVPDLEVAGLVS